MSDEKELKRLTRRGFVTAAVSAAAGFGAWEGVGSREPAPAAAGGAA